jgi:hypothetical protein
VKCVEVALLALSRYAKSRDNLHEQLSVSLIVVGYLDAFLVIVFCTND